MVQITEFQDFEKSEYRLFLGLTTILTKWVKSLRCIYATDMLNYENANLTTEWALVTTG